MVSALLPDSILIMEGVHDPLGTSGSSMLLEASLAPTALEKRLQPGVMEGYVRAREGAATRGHKWAVKALEGRMKAGVVRSWGQKGGEGLGLPLHGREDYSSSGGRTGATATTFLGRATQVLDKADSWINSNIQNLSSSSRTS